MSKSARFVRRDRLVLASLTLGAVLGSPALALADPSETGVETVVVTAEKRPENVQNVPLAISAFSGDRLEKQNITTAADLARYVPSLTINTSNNNRNSQIVIRNVGTSGTNPGTEQDVGVFLDGVYIPVAGPIYNQLSDISTVEVLRGPQARSMAATRRSAPSTSRPARRPRIPRRMSTSNTAITEKCAQTGNAGGALADDVAGRVSLWSDNHSGYLKNLYTNSDVDDGHQYGGRGRVRWTPDDQTTVDLIGYYAYNSSDGNNLVQVNPLGPGGIVFGYNPIPQSFDQSPFVIAQKATNPLHPFVVTGPWQVNSADLALDTATTYGVSAQVNRDIPLLDATLHRHRGLQQLSRLRAEPGPGRLAARHRGQPAARPHQLDEQRVALGSPTARISSTMSRASISSTTI